MASKGWAAQVGRWIVAGIASVALTGCSGFFPPLDSSSGGSGGSGGGTGNYVLALSPDLGTLSVYTIGTSKLSIGSGSPLTLPSNLVSANSGAIAVTRNNSFVYVGGLNAIYCYSIGTSGALSLVNAGSQTIAANVVSMDASPDGQWLFALDNLSQTVFEFSLNSSTGALALVNQVPYNIKSGATLVPKSIRATSTLVAAALGTAGDALFALTTSNGNLTYSGGISLNSATESDNDVAISSDSSFLYVSRSGTADGIAAYTVNSSGVPSTFGSGALTASGTTPNAMLLDSTGAYLYAANRGSSDISEYTVSAGTLKALSTPTVSAGMIVTSMARDSTGKYVLVGGVSSTTDVGMYSFDSTVPGQLDLATSVSTGKETVGVQVATTH
ncbi:lactonase family protein [Granulicella sp. WH15]|uniref:beta-propeller fold lactonase family protein n=1 Tax=Granulicella sp. WH15 TaxID=2602070 RepID=UPI001367169D|nr:beta-propeller fold lactonase family protein [Granulicella sp. WH15]QHN04559.1 lactonase family protein [Granulicella sp. WH15]